MNFNYFFRLSELCKTFRCLIFSNSKKKDRNVLGFITETFNGHEVVRHENNRKMRKIFHLIHVIFEPAEHQKHSINCFFIVDKTLAYRTSLSDRGKCSHGKCYECYHGSQFYVRRERCKRYIKSCLCIPVIIYSFESENTASNITFLLFCIVILKRVLLKAFMWILRMMKCILFCAFFVCISSLAKSQWNINSEKFWSFLALTVCCF